MTWYLFALLGGALVVTTAVGGSLIQGITVVPHSSDVIVERFGRYHRTLHAGPHVVVPYIDRIRSRVDLREQVVPFPPQLVLTQDKLLAHVDTVVYYQVVDARAATYEVANCNGAIEQLLVATLRNVVGGMGMDRALATRDQISGALRTAVAVGARRWGVRINRVELKAIEPPPALRGALEDAERAERERRAAISRAEGEKRAALLRAEAEREVKELLAGGRPPPHPAVPADARADAQAGGVPDTAGSLHPLQEGDPSHIDRFVLRARLGEGGMGRVFLGHTPSRRLVAVKQLLSEFAGADEFRRRFAREIEAARRVSGFYTAQLVAADPEADPPWLATDYIPGPTLWEVIRHHGTLPPRSLHALAAGVAEALASVHECGFVHRDLKPGNIIVAPDGPRLIDFGIARALDDQAALTAAHLVVGTQGFLAPEQLAGERVTFAVDMYAYGKVMCQAAGAIPVEGTAVAREVRPAALRLLPAMLQSLVARCLDADPARRPTAPEVVAELSEGLDTEANWLPPALRTMVSLHHRTTVTLALGEQRPTERRPAERRPTEDG